MNGLWEREEARVYFSSGTLEMHWLNSRMEPGGIPECGVSCPMDMSMGWCVRVGAGRQGGPSSLLESRSFPRNFALAHNLCSLVSPSKRLSCLVSLPRRRHLTLATYYGCTLFLAVSRSSFSHLSFCWSKREIERNRKESSEWLGGKRRFRLSQGF